MKYVSPTVPGSENYNVKTYGAKGDNSTNDYAAIMAAINAVPSSGGVVYFPPGTYVTNTAITPKSNVTFLGAGATVSTIKQTSTTLNALAAVDIRNFTMQSMGLLGPNSGSGSGVVFTRSGNPDTAYLAFRDVYIRQFAGGKGIDISNPIVSTFENVNCENNSTGYYLHGDSGVAGTSVSFISCYANTNSAVGFNLFNMAYTSLHGCASEGSATNYLIDTCQSVALNGCGSEAMASGGTGFKVTGGFSVKLDSCWDLGNRGKSFWVTGNHLNGVIQGCAENTPGVGATASIQIDSGSKVMAFQNSYTTAATLNGLSPQIIGNFGFTGALFLGPNADAYMYRNAANEVGTDGYFVQNAGNPTAPNHTATKAYVDARVLTGSGAPAVAAPVGTLYLRTDGGASTTLYVKESGTGTSGWVAK